MKEIYDYFPQKISNIIKNNITQEDLEEIRIRVQKPIILKLKNKEKVLNYVISKDDIDNILQLICENSIYSYQSQIAEGFVTIDGGHRVGISGTCVNKDEKVININYINSLNFRISKQILNCSNSILNYILDLKNNSIYNTLIVAPPGIGKTTLLRDIVRQISNGIRQINFNGLTVGLVDERGEIASLYKGIPRNEIGIRTDVIEDVSKSIGMRMLVRSMAPQVIVADEIGNDEDVKAINYAVCSGSKGIFTAHGKDFYDLKINPILEELIDMHIFEIVVILDEIQKGKAKEIYILNREKFEYKLISDEYINKKIVNDY